MPQQPFFSKLEPPVFSDNVGLVVLEDCGRAIGYSLYRLIEIDDSPVIHRWFSQITPKYQGRQLYRQITRVIVQYAIDRFGEKQIYYCGRTRTPVGWQALEKYTKRLAPDLVYGKYHPDLIRIAVGMREVIYPRKTLEIPTLGMRNAFEDGTQYHIPRHIEDKRLDEIFYGQPIIEHLDAAILFVGELDEREIFK
ncbi:MAG: hypothetical protein MPJ78_01185 [Hyphomicrobiaceae bacterium]|nr:hypothetical protein [Hyphomicrobiaceae bacterium]